MKIVDQLESLGQGLKVWEQGLQHLRDIFWKTKVILPPLGCFAALSHVHWTATEHPLLHYTKAM